MTPLDGFLATWSRARATFGTGIPRGGEWLDGDRLSQLQTAVDAAHPGSYWTGAAATAYGERNARQAQRIGRVAVLDRELGSCVTESALTVSVGRQSLEAVRDWVLATARAVPPGSHREQFLAPIVLQGLTQLRQAVTSSSSELDVIASRIRLLADEYADLRTEEERQGQNEDDETSSIQSVDLKQGPGGVGDRRFNEIEAFHTVFGRLPVSAADWTTAAVLDPHSYDPAAAGVAPEVVLARIDPVAGQGVVRVGQWIEQRDVISGPWRRDFGNTRGADPQFDPANTKVTAYIDYENGLVVMRQNPSVELTPDGGPGDVRVGVPEAAVQQLPDGSVRIQYDAGNPFAPDIATNPPWPLQDNPWTVNGDLVVTPTADGVRVDGTRTDYPLDGGVSRPPRRDDSDGTDRSGHSRELNGGADDQSAAAS